MKEVVPYGFNRDAAKRMGRAKFLQKFKALFPHLPLEQIWDKMFPAKAKANKDSESDN